MEFRPITQKRAFLFIRQEHRHHDAPQGWLFGTSLWVDERLAGVICVGRPVARMLDCGLVAEATRVCTDGTDNACSALYGAAWRAAKAIGYRSMITYTRGDELGSSPLAANFKLIGISGGGQWDRQSRPRRRSGNHCQKFVWRIGEPLAGEDSEQAEKAMSMFRWLRDIANGIEQEAA